MRKPRRKKQETKISAGTHADVFRLLTEIDGVKPYAWITGGSYWDVYDPHPPSGTIFMVHRGKARFPDGSVVPDTPDPAVAGREVEVVLGDQVKQPTAVMLDA